ncbi:interleukin-11 receptor subunit alpha [Sphaerodactylus townsendi]|uniref:interleukin-11 receptor subunit alpha n=1 Tax=Sphaerodactylus townsendi TaxID=933632 RepID=UPI002026E74B|nr:interleukin-11 receptor subunit alpha [Sphaerodactylus townsendi]
MPPSLANLPSKAKHAQSNVLNPRVPASSLANVIIGFFGMKNGTSSRRLRDSSGCAHLPVVGRPRHSSSLRIIQAYKYGCHPPGGTWRWSLSRAGLSESPPLGLCVDRSKTSDVGLCLQDPAHPHSCTVSKSQFWSTYRVNVTEVNPLGSNFRLLDFAVQAILKPDPPEGLRVEPVPSAPRRLRVSWEYPSTWPNEPHFQLKFRLQYRPVMHSSWSMVETANVSEMITDAFMGLEHVVQVSAKDFLDAGSWSEWSSEARGIPALGQTVAPSEAATAAVEPESPAEEPSLAPNNEPVAGRSDPLEKVAVLVSLGVFAFFVLAVILVFAFLMWIRMKKHSKEATKNHDLLSATIHMKALPKAQIL